MSITKPQRLIRPPRLPQLRSRRWAIAFVLAGIPAAALYMHAERFVVDAALIGGVLLGVTLTGSVVVESSRTLRLGAIHRHRELEQTPISDLSRSELMVLAQRHHALRRAATLIARGASPADVLGTVAEQLVDCLNAETAAMFRFETDGTVVLLGRYTAGQKPSAGNGSQLRLRADAARVLPDGTASEMESHESVAGTVAAHLRKLCLESAVVAPVIVDNRAWGLLVAGSSREQPLRRNAESALGDFADLVATAIANANAREELQTSRESLAGLATQQDALRRIATLVARGAEPDECFAAVAQEMARCLAVDKGEVFRYADDGSAVAVACHASPGIPYIRIGERVTAEDTVIATELFRTGRASCVDGHEDAPPSVASRLRELRLGSVAGAPIVVDGRVWGMAVVGSTGANPLPPDTQQRIAEFADLVTTSIAACTTRAELIASRARIVAAADDARRRLERDLHDGAQQRLVSLHLKLRAAAADVPDELDALKGGMAEVVSDLTEVTEELQEISRGIHPAVLSKGGLAPALKALSSRSPIPATVDIAIDGPVPEHVEVAAYYIVAEALTNAAKHSHATEITVSADCADGNLYLSVTDNGIGGANAGRGSGLVGLTDRVEALGGKMAVMSVSGNGTSLIATIPVSALQTVWSSGSGTQRVLLPR